MWPKSGASKSTNLDTMSPRAEGHIHELMVYFARNGLVGLGACFKSLYTYMGKINDSYWLTSQGLEQLFGLHTQFPWKGTTLEVKWAMTTEQGLMFQKVKLIFQHGFNSSTSDTSGSIFWPRNTSAMSWCRPTTTLVLLHLARWLTARICSWKEPRIFTSLGGDVSGFSTALCSFPEVIDASIFPNPTRTSLSFLDWEWLKSQPFQVSDFRMACHGMEHVRFPTSWI